MDANEYALKVQPAAKALAVLLNKAEWLGKGTEPAAKEETVSPLAAEVVSEAVPEKKGGDIAIAFGDRRYRVRGLEKNTSHDLLKINLLASKADAIHVDTRDLYSARQRAVFIKQAAIEMEVKEDVVKHDLGRLLLQLKRCRSGRSAKPSLRSAKSR